VKSVGDGSKGCRGQKSTSFGTRDKKRGNGSRKKRFTTKGTGENGDQVQCGVDTSKK